MFRGENIELRVRVRECEAQHKSSQQRLSPDLDKQDTNLVSFGVCFVFRDSIAMYLRLILNSLCRSGWP